MQLQHTTASLAGVSRFASEWSSTSLKKLIMYTNTL
eukprot:CAMPEP_0182594258 /NCGR_PEP_ID=MMETSP1324-20130603/79809_1 /TAXON_ID=236786 /ORGANISM="Florenciella sp., Strain RCC1587" /LENGTH=35 /DNA_ID= /DNA_START= /DNA_END= /DNA_ORIENTATION=